MTSTASSMVYFREIFPITVRVIVFVEFLTAKNQTFLADKISHKISEQSDYSSSPLQFDSCRNRSSHPNILPKSQNPQSHDDVRVGDDFIALKG